MLSERRQVFFSVLLIIALGFGVYANTLTGKFIWDDEHLIVNNTFIKNAHHIGKIFRENIGAGAQVRYRFYRPLQMLSYMADHALWKLDPRGYHLTNIVLHVLAALCLLWLMRMLFHDVFLATVTSALFVVHPVHTEAVAYISGRADPLALLFLLLSFVFYLRAASSRGAGSYVLTGLCFTLALLSKESSLILPVLLLLYHYSFRMKIDMKGFAIIAGLAVLYVVLRLTVLSALLAGIVSTSTLMQRLPGFFIAVMSYMRLLCVPVHLHMEYGNGLFAWSDPRVLPGLAGFGAFLVTTFRQRRRDRDVFFALAWFLTALVPVSNLYPVNAFMAEHWLYLPSIGFCLLAAKVAGHFYRNGTYRNVTVVVLIGVLAVYSYLTMRQNTTWSDPVSLYKRTLEFAPKSAKVYYNLGNVYAAQKKYGEAIAAFESAVRLKRDYPTAYNNLGVIYGLTGRDNEAIAAFKQAAQQKTDYAEPHYNLGNRYLAMGLYDAAADAFKEAIAILPNYANAYYRLGVTYKAERKYDEAVSVLKKAVELKPDFLEAANDLGVAYAAMGRNEEAVASYKKAIAIEPGYARAYNNLADVYLRTGKTGLAMEHADQAAALGLVNQALLEALKPYRK